tara:strand:- start:2028 stop:2321 length:294 start_codon:yes stop_codon:yes gene_type:complete
MTCKVIAEWNMKDGKAADLVEDCRGLFPVTRTFDGCIMIDVSIAQDDQNLVIMTEEWASKEHHLAYMKFRTEDGTVANIMPMLTGAPKFTYLELSDA